MDFTQLGISLYGLLAGNSQQNLPQATLVARRERTTSNEMFSKNNMSAEITKYMIEEDETETEYVGYHVEVNVKDLNWTLKKRYSECLDFHTKLMAALTAKDQQKLFVFPPKLYTKQSNFNVENIEQRLTQLQNWFDTIVSADPAWFTNYEALMYEFLETDKSLAKYVARECTVTLSVAEEKIKGANATNGLPDVAQIISDLMTEKANQVMEQAGCTFEIASEALLKNEKTVNFAVSYLKNIEKIMQQTGLTDRKIVGELYKKTGFSVNFAIDTYKRNPNLIHNLSVSDESSDDEE